MTKTVVTAQEELGNLVAPLSLAQVSGVWLSGDYRVLPTAGPGIDKLEVTYVLIGVVVAAGVLGVAWLVRNRALGPLLFLAVSLIALAYVTRRGSPWADAKALAIASPAVLLMAALGPLALEARGARLEALGLAAALVIGVLGSNALDLPRCEPRAARAPGRAGHRGGAHGGARAGALHRVRGVCEALPA